MSRFIRIGSRASALSIAQARLVMDAVARSHPEITLKLVTMKTLGDLHPDLPLENTSGSGKNTGAGSKTLFTGALEEALSRNDLDLCIHSLKDMAENVSEDLPIVAMPKRGDPRDTLILPAGQRFGGIDRLDRTVPAGCSSVRRRIQLRALVPSLTFSPIRGNVPTRIHKLDEGQFSLLVLAAAGLERLNISSRAAYFFPVRKMIPAAGQGVLAVQGRRSEDYGFLDAVRDLVTETEALTERAFVRAAGGGCGSPAAAFARIAGNEISLLALFAKDGEAPFYTGEISGPKEKGQKLAEQLAQRLLRQAGL
jgi:hydroxymethylbilane synthase